MKNFNNIKGIVAIIMFATLVNSCKKEENLVGPQTSADKTIKVVHDGGSLTTEGDVVLKANAKILSPEQIKSIVEVSDNYIIFSSNSSIVIGDVINCGISEKTPYGILRKVIMVEGAPAGVKIVTEPAKLEDAIAKCNVIYKKEYTDDELKQFYMKDMEMSRLIYSSGSISGSTTVDYSKTLNTNPFVKFYLKDEIKPYFFCEITIDDKGDNNALTNSVAKIGLKADVTNIVTLGIEASKSWSYNSSVDFKSIPLPSLVFPVGPITVVIANSITSGGTVKLSASGTVKYSVAATTRFSSFAKYNYNNDKQWTMGTTGPSTSFSSGSLTTNINAYIQPSLNIGVKMDLYKMETAVLTPSVTTNAKLDYNNLRIAGQRMQLSMWFTGNANAKIGICPWCVQKNFSLFSTAPKVLWQK